MSTNDDFYLVQRLELRDPVDDARGFDGFFRCEYMGSAEFEFGAIPASLKRIRAAGAVRVMKTPVRYEGVNRVVYFVCRPVGFEETTAAFREWLYCGCRGKEWTNLPERFKGDDRWAGNTVAWWSLNNDVLFTLDGDVADRLVTAINAKAGQ